jgi:hypothetical protein
MEASPDLLYYKRFFIQAKHNWQLKSCLTSKAAFEIRAKLEADCALQIARAQGPQSTVGGRRCGHCVIVICDSCCTALGSQSRAIRMMLTIHRVTEYPSEQLPVTPSPCSIMLFLEYTSMKWKKHAAHDALTHLARTPDKISLESWSSASVSSFRPSRRTPQESS